MKLTVVMPARNEVGCIEETVTSVAATLRSHGIAHELIVVDDGSTDGTFDTLRRLQQEMPALTVVSNRGRHGFGMAVRAGLVHMTGDAAAIMMADGSDSPADLVRYYETLAQGYECVFGSRFMKGSTIVDYPAHKRVINRLANWFVKMLFGLSYNDTTNAFKCYRRDVIEGMAPLISPHFNLTVEMPLKAMIRGYSYAVIPISWTNRKAGTSKLKLTEMGSRYLFVVLYLWLEKHLTRGDYHRGHVRGDEPTVQLAPGGGPEGAEIAPR